MIIVASRVSQTLPLLAARQVIAGDWCMAVVGRRSLSVDRPHHPLPLVGVGVVFRTYDEYSTQYRYVFVLNRTAMHPHRTAMHPYRTAMHPYPGH